MLKKCKCHGVSGSCSFQTCWMQMPSFTEIAKELRDRYHNSILISFEKVREGLTLGNSARHLPLVEDHLPNNLVYLERSDSFCFSNNTTGKKVIFVASKLFTLFAFCAGIAGTKGRVCSRTTARNATIEERKSCRNLCRSCGYKVRKYEKQTTYQCNCKFSWCCDVKCDLCVQKENEFFCA
jgi:wingless-type MMTV integration site family protein 8